MKQLLHARRWLKPGGSSLALPVTDDKQAVVLDELVELLEEVVADDGFLVQVEEELPPRSLVVARPPTLQELIEEFPEAPEELLPVSECQKLSRLLHVVEEILLLSELVV